MRDFSKNLILIVFFVLVIFIFWEIYKSLDKSDAVQDRMAVLSGENAQVFIGKTRLIVGVADTSEARVQGLSGIDSIAPNRGLLFVFESSDRHGIWMKDMNISIDIVWINENMRVVHIEENVHPDTYPITFYPESSAIFVLETAAGVVSNAGLSVGDSVVIEGL